MPFYRIVVDGDPERVDAGARLMQCLLWSEPGDPNAAMELARRFLVAGNSGEYFARTVRRFRHFNRLEEYLTIIKNGGLDHRPLKDLAYGYAALDRSDLAAARDHFQRLWDGRDKIELPRDEWRQVLMHWLPLVRIGGQEPDWQSLRRETEQERRGAPWLQLVFEWISSEASWEASRALMAKVADGDDLLFARSLVDLTTGEHATAQTGLQVIATRHPTWFEAVTARRLLAWYATQTPETLARLSRAKPVAGPVVSNSPAASGANDF